MVLHILLSVKWSMSSTVCNEQKEYGSSVSCYFVPLYTHLQSTFIYLKGWLNDTFLILLYGYFSHT